MFHDNIIKSISTYTRGQGLVCRCLAMNTDQFIAQQGFIILTAKKKKKIIVN